MGVETKSTARVVLADRSALVRNMVRAVCDRRGLDVVGEATAGWQLFGICRSRRPDIVLTDAELHDGPITGCMSSLLALGTKVVILCDDASSDLLTLLERG